MIKRQKVQKGSVLLEALVAILIFSFGILALVALQAVAIKNSIDAKYRSDASYLANQIIGQIWVDRANVANYGHYQTGPLCAFTGSPSANISPWVTPVTSWVTQAAGLLPGMSDNKAQVLVTDIGNTKRVKVTLCWKTPQETSHHNFTVTAQINLP